MKNFYNEQLFKWYCEEYFGNDDLRYNWKRFVTIMYVLHPNHEWTHEELITRFKKAVETLKGDCTKILVAKIKSLDTSKFHAKLNEYFSHQSNRYFYIYG